MASVVGVPTPNPTCALCRPAPMASVTRSWKETLLALNAMVFKFARLLPVTSMAVEKADRAESAVENEAMVVLPYECGAVCRDCWELPDTEAPDEDVPVAGAGV